MNTEEIREKLAEFMGWTAIDLDNSCGDADCCGGPFPMWTYCQKDEDGDWMGISLAETGPYSGSLNVEDWQPDKDRNQLALVLEKVGKAGLEKEVMLTIARLVGAFNVPDAWFEQSIWKHHFKILLAPPKTICQAIISVIDKEIAHD